jgi:hypothetical protein
MQQNTGGLLGESMVPAVILWLAANLFVWALQISRSISRGASVWALVSLPAILALILFLRLFLDQQLDIISVASFAALIGASLLFLLTSIICLCRNRKPLDEPDDPARGKRIASGTLVLFCVTVIGAVLYHKAPTTSRNLSAPTIDFSDLGVLVEPQPTPSPQLPPAQVFMVLICTLMALVGLVLFCTTFASRKERQFQPRALSSSNAERPQ